LAYSYPVFVYDYPKGDYSGLCSYLLDCDFDPCYQSQDVEFIWSFISSKITDAMVQFIPRVRLRKHQRPKWITASIKHKLNKLNTLKRRLSKKASDLKVLKLQCMELDVEESLRIAKSNYESALVSDFAGHKNAAIFRYMKSLSSSSDFPPTMFLGSKSATSSKDKAILFNEYFYSVFTLPSGSVCGGIDMTASSNLVSTLS